MRLYQRFATTFGAMKRCNSEWKYRHESTIERLITHLPHGSGFDAAPSVSLPRPKLLEIVAPFHAMDPNGFYAGWIDVKIKASPGWNGVDLEVTINSYGRKTLRDADQDVDQFKDYVADVYREALETYVGD